MVRGLAAGPTRSTLTQRCCRSAAPGPPGPVAGTQRGGWVRRVGGSFQTAVWQLIDHNGLVVDLAEGSAADGDRTWQDSWRVRYPSFHQVRRRRTFPHEKPWPSHREGSPLAFSTKASAVRMRAKRQAAREEETKQRWLDARRRLARRDEDVDAGRLRPYLPGSATLFRRTWTSWQGVGWRRGSPLPPWAPKGRPYRPDDTTTRR